MGKQYFVEQLQRGQTVDDVFVITSSNVYEYSRGFRHALRLADRTGKIDAVHWDCDENDARHFPADTVVHIGGQVGEYNGKPQVTIEKMQPVAPGDVDRHDFLPVCPRPLDDMEHELRELVDSVGDPGLCAVCCAFLDSDAYDYFKEAPGGKRWHHGYLHGLLEHVLSVMQLADRMCTHYPDVNRDVVLTAGLLHDVGKIRELGVGLSFDYTKPGRLLGHQVMSIPLVNRFLNTVDDLDTELVLQVLHAIAAHHGEAEGSLTHPKTREALILHMADDLDAKMNAWTRELNQAHENGQEWTDYIRLMNRHLYAGPLPDTPQDPADTTDP